MPDLFGNKSFQEKNKEKKRNVKVKTVVADIDNSVKNTNISRMAVLMSQNSDNTVKRDVIKEINPDNFIKPPINYIGD